MNLQQAYSRCVGTSVPSPDGNPADAGQCVSWASYVLKNVYDHPYVFANAIDWWKNPGLADEFDFVPFGAGSYPKAGDFVVWGNKVGSPYGHIAVCAQDGDPLHFTSYDSNWGDIPRLTTIHHNYAYGILGYIRKKGDEMFKGRTAEQWAAIATRNQVALDQANASNSFNGKTAHEWFSVSLEYDGRIKALQSALDQANAKLTALQQAPVASGLDATTKAEIDNTNSIVNKILSLLQKIFVGSK